MKACSAVIGLVPVDTQMNRRCEANLCMFATFCCEHTKEKRYPCTCIYFKGP